MFQTSISSILHFVSFPARLGLCSWLILWTYLKMFQACIHMGIRICFLVCYNCCLVYLNAINKSLKFASPKPGLKVSSFCFIALSDFLFKNWSFHSTSIFSITHRKQKGTFIMRVQIFTNPASWIISTKDMASICFY
jgi:hypothetical protein